jgi:hypothetical protein
MPVQVRDAGKPNAQDDKIRLFEEAKVCLPRFCSSDGCGACGSGGGSSSGGGGGGGGVVEVVVVVAGGG